MNQTEAAFEEWRESHYLTECADADAEHCAFMCGVAFALTYLTPRQIQLPRDYGK